MSIKAIYTLVYIVSILCLSRLIYDDLISGNIKPMINISLMIVIGTIAYVWLIRKKYEQN